MENKFDINSFVQTQTINSVTQKLVERVKERRQEAKLSRYILSHRSGVSFASIRRFEETGEISLKSLLKIADALGCLDDFNRLFENEIISNLEDYFND
ncbi:MAG TPA: XRE family transcriptional regulator [Clostridiales bacterium]|nr:XRE family transcriptional regulator [Clostridiales bacterium]